MAARTILKSLVSGVESFVRPYGNHIIMPDYNCGVIEFNSCFATCRLSTEPMDAFDFYCAICGAPFKIPLDEWESLQPETDSTAGLQKKFEWLTHLRIIGRNTTTGAAYLTGPGTSTGYGWTLVEAGDDPNVPVSGQAQGRGDGKVGLPAYYDWSAMGDGDLEMAPYPVHCACFEIWRRVCGMEGEGESVERLRTAMERRVGDGGGYLGEVNYFELQQTAIETIWDEDEDVRRRLVRTFSDAFDHGN
jgi:hypothetical protein